MKRRTRNILLGVGLVGVGVGVVYVATRPSSPRIDHPVGLAWGAKFTPEERAKIVAIGQRLDIDPSWLTTIMTAESGRRSHIHIIPIGKDASGKVRYKVSEQVPIEPGTIGGGLIGFMRGTATGMGISLEDLLAMDRFNQLDYVEKFYENHRKSGVIPPNPSLWRVYMATFLPAYAREADNPSFVLAEKNSPVAKSRKIYAYNAAADRDGDGDIEVQEAMAKMSGILKKGLQKGNVF